MPPLPALLPQTGPAVAITVPGLGLTAASYGGLVDALTVIGLAAGLRERVGTVRR